MKILQIFFVGVLYLFVFVPSAFAIDPPCAPDDKRVECKFGTIVAPSPLAGFLAKDPTGAGAISTFLSNFVALIFTLAAVVLVLMILWGAFEWMISEGDKEKLSAAQRKIINAIIGIILFAIAFAIIRLLGTFTGFTFFEGQNFKVYRDANGRINKVDCLNGRTLYGSFDNRDYASECK